MHEYDERWSENDVCPNCHVGRIHTKNRPYLKLYQGKLFTMPDALCYQCDVCDYYEYDEATFDVISDMMFGATQAAKDDTQARHLQAPSDDELPQTGKLPRI